MCVYVWCLVALYEEVCVSAPQGHQESVSKKVIKLCFAVSKRKKSRHAHARTHNENYLRAVKSQYTCAKFISTKWSSYHRRWQHPEYSSRQGKKAFTHTNMRFSHTYSHNNCKNAEPVYICSSVLRPLHLLPPRQRYGT